MMKIQLDEIIAPSFYDLHRDIRAGVHTEYFLKGGRGSTKSSFVSIQIVMGMMLDKNANAVVLRKVDGSLEISVIEQILWAIDMLGAADRWRYYSTKQMIEYLPFGQKILFRGAANPILLRSIKLKHGYFKYIWYEELDEFKSADEVRTINQTFMRSSGDFRVFYTYNPPKNISNWVNLEAQTQKENREVNHSTYLDVPKNWLGNAFIFEAQYLKKTNEKAYNHEYLGQVTGAGGEVFTNIISLRLTDEQVASFDAVRHGIDWGYAVDPFCYIKCFMTKRRLYVFDEIYKVGLSNHRAQSLISAKNPLNEYITADSSEPKSIDELRSYGLRIKPAKKGPGSIEYGIKYLCAFDEILIDPIRCSNAYRELSCYELLPDGYGSFVSKYPDKNNHAIDAIRYALEDDMRFGGGGMRIVR